MKRALLPLLAARGALIVAWAVVTLWVAGLVLSDRFAWSQWLAWIPSPSVALAALGTAWLLWLARGKNWRAHAALMASIVIAAGAWSVHANLGLGGTARGTGPSISVLQWNTDWPSGDDPRSEVALAAHPADFVLISNRGAITAADRVQAWAGPDARVFGAGPFALVTRWPVVEATQIAAGGQGRQLWWVGRFTVVPPGWEGRPLRIGMIDLPSRPTLSRAAIAAALAKACEQGGLGEVDMVAGDFNATESSMILRTCFGGMQDALSEGGRGWLATWPRVLPLWRIDHILISPRLEARNGWVIDPGVSHHRMSMAIVGERRAVGPEGP